MTNETISEPLSDHGEEPSDFFRLSNFAHLHPCTQTELIDRVAAVIFHQPALFFGLGALSALPGLIVMLVNPGFSGASGTQEVSMSDAFITMIPWFLKEWPVAALILAGFQKFVFPKRTMKMWVAMQTSLSILLAFIGTRLFAWTIIMGLLLFVLSVGTTGGGGIAGMLALPALVMALILLIYWSLTGVAVIIERTSFITAMARSWKILRQRFRGKKLTDSPLSRLLLILIIPAVLFIVEQISLQTLGFFYPGGAYPKPPVDPSFTIPAGAIMFFFQTIRAPWLYVGLTMVYLECRMRNESLDIRIRLVEEKVGDDGTGFLPTKA
ncbi:hypothetical protein CVU37_14295 [candidate division BRC1 bacterium HGW-BRC1-1]|jgi:hypothetical protein|nr:MAG: hypothetical protein CVU37_14295 [candidate division BRC1 bacterium HGW-BRC1-1]